MKRPVPSSEPLPNPRHEAFAHEVASGRSATQAYLNIYGTENRRVACTGGSRLLRRKSILARIKSLQKAGAANVVLSLQEIHDFLTRVVRTPAGQIVPSSDLCTRVKHTRDGGTDVWMPNKLACLRLSAKLQGFLDTARLAQTASAARTARTQLEPPPPARLAQTPPPILTEEQREILMTQRSAALQKQAEEQRLEKPSIPQESPSDASKKLAEPETHPPEKSLPIRSPQAAVLNPQPPPVRPEPPIWPRPPVRPEPPIWPRPPVRPEPPVWPRPPVRPGPLNHSIPRLPDHGSRTGDRAKPETRLRVSEVQGAMGTNQKP